MARSKPIDIADRRELFTDDLLIDKLKKSQLKLHEPQPQNVALRFNKPWEGSVTKTCTLVKDGDRYLLYYRAWGKMGIPKLASVCVAESDDGINFTRPSLGLHSHKGSKKNNIVISDNPACQAFSPFQDHNPKAKKNERFKALANNAYGVTDKALHGWVSEDGYHWKLLRKKPIIFNDSKHNKFAFDSQNLAFWSEVEQQYIAFFRTWSPLTNPGPNTVTEPRHGLRRISRATSKDFRNWQPSVLMDYKTLGEPSPEEHLYVNQTEPYFRAPHLYVAFPARFMQALQAITIEEAEQLKLHPNLIKGPSEACFMTTRPGQDYYDRTFMEPFRKPDIGAGHWASRCNYPAHGIVQTSPTELSIYIDEFYAQQTNQIRRFSMRLDGFISVSAPYMGGEMTTKPLKFDGDELELNYATGVSGGLRVEIQDADGKAIPGYTLRDAVEVIGNKIDGRAVWKHGNSVRKLAGKPVRLRFVMRDCDLYSMRFCCE